MEYSNHGQEGKFLSLGRLEYYLISKLDKKENERRVREILNPYFNRDIFMSEEFTEAFEEIKELKKLGEHELYKIAYKHLTDISV